MGIKQLSKLISELAPNAVTIERISDWKGRRVAIDVSNYLYQFVYKPESKKPNNHLAGFFQLVYECATAGVLPVMILDGKPAQAKAHILEQRKQLLENKQSKIDQLNEQLVDLEKQLVTKPHLISDFKARQNQVKMLDNQIINVHDDMWSEIRVLFDLLGVPVLQATYEADLLASRLCQKGLVHAVISEDLDHLTFGAACLIRDFNNKREPDCRVYRLAPVLQDLGLTHDQFIDVCILCGCDYTPKIEGIAWKRAYQLIKSHGSIEPIIEAINTGQKGFSKFSLPEEFNYQEARQLFKLEADELVIEIKPNQLQVQSLKNLLIERCRYRESTLIPKINQIELLYQKFSAPSKVKIPKPKIRVKTV